MSKTIPRLDYVTQMLLIINHFFEHFWQVMEIDVLLQYGIIRKTVIHIFPTHFFDKFKQITIFCRYLISQEEQSRSWICWRSIFDKIQYFINNKLEKWTNFLRDFCSFFGTMKHLWHLPAGSYMFKANNRNTRTWCEICSKSTIKTTERRQIGWM